MPFCFLLLLAQYVPTDFKAELFGGYANLRAEKQTQQGWTATYTDYSTSSATARPGRSQAVLLSADKRGGRFEAGSAGH